MSGRKVNEFDINLDRGGDKWHQLIEYYKHDIRKVYKSLREEIDTLFGKLFSSILSWLPEPIVYYKSEIEYIANECGIPVGHMAAIQLVYEFAAKCTTIMVEKEEGVVSMFRTLDWDLRLLKNLTVKLNFYSGGKHIYSATSWAGFVGILTAMKPNVGCVAVNFRCSKEGSFASNLLQMGMLQWPISYLIRKAMEEQDTFEGLEKTLKENVCVAPCFISLCHSTDITRCQIITKDRDKYKVEYVRDKKYLIQTNICNIESFDEQIDILHSLDRIKTAESVLEDKGHNLFDNLQVFPIINEETIYVSIMVPDKGLYENHTLLDSQPMEEKEQKEKSCNLLLYILVALLLVAIIAMW